MRMSIPTAWVAVPLVLLLGACGTVGAPADQAPDRDASTPSSETPGQPWLTSAGDVLVTCDDSPAFPASIADEGGVDVGPDEAEAIVAALADLKEMDPYSPLEDASAQDVTWIVLWRDTEGEEETLGLLLAPPGTTDFSLASDEHLRLNRQEGRWTVGRWGGTCGTRPSVPAETAWAQVALPAESATPAGAAVELLVSEIECTSARDPDPFLAEPVVVETDEAVTVYWTTERMTGDAECPGNPWVPRTVELDHDLGNRTLLDGSTWPPTPVTVVDSYR